MRILKSKKTIRDKIEFDQGQKSLIRDLNEDEDQFMELDYKFYNADRYAHELKEFFVLPKGEEIVEVIDETEQK